MPLDLAHLRAKSARVVIEGDSPVLIDYRPHLIDGAAINSLLEIASGAIQEEPAAYALTHLISDWDITDGGTPLRVSVPSIRALPPGIVPAIALAIYRDVADLGPARTALGRWLATGGQVGEAPEYWSIIRSARYLGVPPWDLAGLPETRGAYAWVIWAATCQAAEASAEKQLMERSLR